MKQEKLPQGGELSNCRFRSVRYVPRRTIKPQNDETCKQQAHLFEVARRPLQRPLYGTPPTLLPQQRDIGVLQAK